MTLHRPLSFDFARDIAPVASIAQGPFVMLVNPSFPAKTVAEFIAYAKARPGKVNIASNGTGTTSHVAGELFRMMAEVDMVHVPYSGAGPVLTNMLGGEVQVTFDSMASSIGHIRAGRLRALAVTTAARAEVLPDLPTLGDFLPGYEASTWTGIGSPKNTPLGIIEKLNKGINAALADAETKARLAELGGVPMPMTPADFGKFIAEDTEKWAKVISAAHIKVE